MAVLDPYVERFALRIAADVWDESTLALLEALAMFEGRDASFEAKHPRNPLGSPGGGRFRSLASRIAKALEEWADGKGDDNPFEEFDKLQPDPVKRREQFRKVAKERGITLRRGASEIEIKNAILDDVRKGGKSEGEKNGILDGLADGKKSATKVQQPTTARLVRGPDALKAGQIDFSGVRRMEGVTPAERKAVDLYAGDAQRINALIRQGRTGSDTIRNLDRVFRRSRLESDIEVWRGLRTGDQFPPDRDDLTGYEWDEAAYLSTSANRQVAAEFAGSFGDEAPVIMRVVAPSGVGAITISDWGSGHAMGGQAEVLLERGLRLRVVKDHGLTDESGIDAKTRVLDVEIVPGDKKTDTPEAPKPKPPAKKAAPPKPSERPPAKPVPIRDLFASDDATIDTAMRDVWEGQFGPYTTKVDDVSINRGGKHKRGRDVEPDISVSGKVYDEQGNEIGHFGRSIGPVVTHYPDGNVRREMWAEHHVVQLGGGDYDDNPTKYHGKGFGGAFSRRAIDWYRDSGVHGISLSDHNGYVWAAQGFNFSGGVVPDYKADELRVLIDDLRAGKTKNKFGETIPKKLRDAPDLNTQLEEAEALLARLKTTKVGEPDYPTAYEISQLGRRRGQRGKTSLWLGKHLGVSVSEMVLNPDEGEVVNR